MNIAKLTVVLVCTLWQLRCQTTTEAEDEARGPCLNLVKAPSNFILQYSSGSIYFVSITVLLAVFKCIFIYISQWPPLGKLQSYCNFVCTPPGLKGRVLVSIASVQDH